MSLQYQEPLFYRQTIFDLLPDYKDSFEQTLPPQSYDIDINGNKYTAIALNEFKESDYLKKLKEEFQGQPLELTILNENQPFGDSKRISDALFLALSYGISYFNGFNTHDTVWFAELSQAYNLPISYSELIKGGSEGVTNPEELYSFIKIINRIIPNVKSESDPLNYVAEYIGQSCDRILWKYNDNPKIFEQLTEALLFCDPLDGKSFQENIEWRKSLLQNFGIDFARSRFLPTRIMASYLVNMADGMLNVAGIFLSNNIYPRTIEEIMDEISVNEDSVTIHNEYVDRIKILYNDKRASTKEQISTKLSRCLLSWFVSLNFPLNVDLTFDNGSIMSYPNLKYDKTTKQFFYSLPTKQIDSDTNQPLYLIQPIPTFPTILSTAKRLMIKIHPDFISAYNMNCNDPDILVQLDYPFANMSPILPSIEVNQYDDCIVSTDLKGIVDRAIQDPAIHAVVDSMACIV